MRILIVTQCFYPDIYAVNDLVAGLTQRGHQATVLTGLPDYTTSRIPPEYKHFKNRRQQFAGAQVFRVSTIARRTGPFWRSLNYLSFVVTGCLAAAFKKWDEFDVIYVWQVSPVTMAIPALWLKKRFQKPLFLYCMDIWPECVKAMGFHEQGLFFRLVHKLSRWVYRQCDHIAVSSRPFFEYLEKTDGCDRENMSYLPQYGSEDFLAKDFEKKPDDHLDFLFVGNIGKMQNVECILQATAKIKEEKPFTVHIVGGGSSYESCRALAGQLGLEGRVKFYGPRPFAETEEFYRNADACLLTLRGDNKIGDTLPGKLQTYMAAGKPIIGALNGAGAEVIAESGAGLCGPADDAEALAENMRLYMQNPALYAHCGQQARAYFEREFTEQRHFSALEVLLKRMVQQKTDGAPALP